MSRPIRAGPGGGERIDCWRTANRREAVRFFGAPRRSREHTLRMYITDARHFLDDKGAIAPLRGPAKAMADFQRESSPTPPTSTTPA